MNENINQRCIIVTSFDSFKLDMELLKNKLKIDIMVVDEGHKAKNTKTKLRKALKEMTVRR